MGWDSWGSSEAAQWSLWEGWTWSSDDRFPQICAEYSSFGGEKSAEKTGRKTWISG